MFFYFKLIEFAMAVVYLPLQAKNILPTCAKGIYLSEAVSDFIPKGILLWTIEGYIKADNHHKQGLHIF